MLQHTADSEYIRDWDVCGIVKECADDGEAIVMQKNRFACGDRAELLLPDGTVEAFGIGQLQSADERFTPGEQIEAARHAQMLVKMRLPRKVPEGTIMRRENL